MRIIKLMKRTQPTYFLLFCLKFRVIITSRLTAGKDVSFTIFVLKGHRTPNALLQPSVSWPVCIFSLYPCVHERTNSSTGQPQFWTTKKEAASSPRQAGRLPYIGFSFRYESHVWPRLVWHPTAAEPWNHVFKNVGGFKFHYTAWPLHCDRISFIASERQRNYSCRLTKTTLTFAGMAPGVFHHYTVMTSNRCTLTYLLTYLLTYSMEQSPLKSDRFSGS